jgi:YD repeat-containing protein
MHRNNLKPSFVLHLICTALISTPLKAENGWLGYSWSIQPQPDIISACRAVADVAFSAPYWPHPQEDVKRETIRINDVQYQFINPVMAFCTMQVRSLYDPEKFESKALTVIRHGMQCYTEKSFNPGTGACDVTTGESARKQLGTPPFQSCDANTFTGNPINYATGNKVQIEHDFKASIKSPLTLERHYNSQEAIWRHSYSQRLFITPDKIVLRLEDGRQIYFARSGDRTTPESTEQGTLTISDNDNWYEAIWTYTSVTNEKLEFDYKGKIVSKINSLAQKVMIDHSGDTITLTDERGNYLTLKEYGFGQPLSAESRDTLITYTYNDHAQISSVRVKYKEDEHTEHKYYLYEAITNPDLLTGMMDERGIRLATWNYDEQGRAISSEHANGAFKTTITYSDDGSVSVTNELGRTTAYQFKTVQGIKRIISITGQPSSNCPLSNSTFSYNDRGQLSQKTDATGSVTTFNYNDRGLEVGRTEASGTPLARTTTTEWDPSHFLKTKVIESTRTKYYTYDDQGRLSATQIIPN